MAIDVERKKLISIVVPVFNEQENVRPLHAAVSSVFERLADRYDLEFVFTDNHSDDGTFQELARLAGEDPRVRVFRFSRNFGFQRSIHTGYMQARGDAAIQLDCDLQDPPELLPEFLRLWEDGYKIVYGVRSIRREGFLLTAARKLFYRLIDFLSEDPLPYDAGDFRLVDRCVLDELARIEDQTPYVRGTLAVMGFDQIGVPYARAARSRGQSKFRMRDLVGLALDGILSHSIVPLRLSTYAGLAISVVMFLAIFGYIIARFVFGQSWPAGFATTTTLILLSLSLNSLFLGVIGEYLGRIYRQVRKRPLTIIERSIESPSARAAALDTERSGPPSESRLLEAPPRAGGRPPARRA
jgi:glycosyltransferase involved in cell wall biosynthesis